MIKKKEEEKQQQQQQQQNNTTITQQVKGARISFSMGTRRGMAATFLLSTPAYNRYFLLGCI